MNILDILKNTGQKTKKFFSTTPTTINEQGETVPVEGVQPKLDVGGKIAPLVMAAFALKNPEMGAPMLNSYTVSRQNQLEQQKEDAWKQWQVKANQKKEAEEKRRWEITNPTYTVPTTADLAKSSPVDYGQYVQNPMTTGVTMGGGFKPQDQLQGQINNFGQLSDRNNPEMWVAGRTKPQGMTEEGTIDLLDRPQVKNLDGSISTVRSMSFGENGKEILVPTISWDGKTLSDQEAIDQYYKTGQHLGTFNNPESADDYAEKLHNQQEDLYVNKKPKIPFLNFGQEAKSQQAPSLSPEAPAAQLRQPSRLDQFAGQTLPLNEVLRLQALDEQAQEKVKAEREKKAERKAKIDSFSYYENLLPENSPSRAIIADAKKNPDAYNLDFAAKAYLESKSPKAQPVNVKGLNLPGTYLSLFTNNPQLATPENVLSAIKAIKDPLEQQKAVLELDGLKARKILTDAQTRKIEAEIGKIGREGISKTSGKKETASEKKARLNDIIATAGQYKSYTDYVADLKRNSKAFISEFGSAAYQKAIKDAESLPVWQKIITKDPVTGKPKGSYGQGIAFRPNQSSPMRQFFPNYVTKEQVKTTVTQQPKGIKIGGKSVTPVVANEIKSAMKGNDAGKVKQIAKKYGYSVDALLDWYTKNK